MILLSKMRRTCRTSRKSSVQYSSNHLSRRLSNTGICDPHITRFIRTSYKEKKFYQAELNKWIKAHIGLVNKYEKLASDYGQVLDLVSESSAKINNTLNTISDNDIPDKITNNDIPNKNIDNDKFNKPKENYIDSFITYGQGIITGVAISFVIFNRFG
ncbi:hypothetical protein QLL95_gp0115 [Cotonvirus japonicus]|uniref:Uncharacterized protein n=1 Tax=Cotonvirus japonicus TaxID=2811091 RepID=A0ABM7NR30_9VIRU|nr:hypothetical protein QLL95_gp0115 [Cotonvirus japonicus]BCS82604.1 hypothetical protein [Cotonvirus japonicus]